MKVETLAFVDIIFLKKSIIVTSILVLSQCTSSSPERITEEIQNLENLIIYPHDVPALNNIQFEREASYGNTDDLQIGRLGGFSVDDKGRIYLADMQQRCILVLKEDGQLIGQIGRQGNGPGEFQNGPFPSIISDKLYAVDMVALRLSVFHIDSFEVIQTLNLNPKNLSRYDTLLNSHIRQVFPINSDKILLSFVPFYNKVPRSPGQRLERDNVNYFIIDNDRNIISNVIFSYKDTPFLTGIVDGQLQIASHFQLFNELLVTISNNGNIFTAASGNLLIKKYDSEGEYVSAFYYPFEPIRVNRGDALQIQTTDLLREIVKQNDLPETWPVIEELLIDDNNRLWISTIVDNFDIYEWWVLEETGELIAKFEWQRNEPIEVIKNGHIYTRETDSETGLQQIVRYRIEMEEN